MAEECEHVPPECENEVPACSELGTSEMEIGFEHDNVSHEELQSRLAQSYLSCSSCKFKTYSFRALQLHCTRRHTESDEAQNNRKPCRCGRIRKKLFLNKKRKERHVSGQTSVSATLTVNSLATQPSNSKCPHCPYRCNLDTALSIHIKRKHVPLLQSHKCPKCSFSSLIRTLLKEHMKTAGHYDHKCQMCDDVFDSVAQYLDHVSQHVILTSPCRSASHSSEHLSDSIHSVLSASSPIRQVIPSPCRPQFDSFKSSVIPITPNTSLISSTSSSSQPIASVFREAAFGHEVAMNIDNTQIDASTQVEPRVLETFLDPQSTNVDNDMSVDSTALDAATQSELVAVSNSTRQNFECVHCEITFHDVVMYSVHRGTHGFNEPFKCNLCGVKMADKYAFAAHFHCS